MISEELRDYIVNLDWKMLKPRLDAYAAKRLQFKGLSSDRAADVSNLAITNLFNRGLSDWDHQHPNSQAIFDYLKNQIKNIVSDRCKKRKKSIAISAGLSVVLPDTDTGGVYDAQAELELLEKDWKAAHQGDRLAQDLVDCMVTGILKAQDQADLLDVSIDKIRRLREKLSKSLAEIRPNGAHT